MTLAPGWPGIPARWTSSDKSGVGTALSDQSRLWFTLSHGVVNEVYYPRIDRACTRDMGLIVTDGRGFASEEKRDASHIVDLPARGVPSYRIQSRCVQGRYQLDKEILADPARPVLLQRTRFTSLIGTPDDYQLHVLLAPHLCNNGNGNTAWIGEHKGTSMLFAERNGYALALACSSGWHKRSAGFVGASDGWQDVLANHRMTWEYERAENGNVALMGEIVVPPVSREFLLALAFGADAAEAGHRARAALNDGFEQAVTVYHQQWDAWQDRLLPLDAEREHDASDRYRVSTMVMRAHESSSFPGALIASMSIPWGMNKGDEDLGGYHLVWPRDLVQSAGGLLAVGARQEAERVLGYLQATQEADGHWGQNMWLDGTPYWNGIQMDETALPVLLLDLARREGALTDADVSRYWPMVRQAARYLLCSGPVSPQDRWEEDPGYSPYTVGAQIAALLIAAEQADKHNDRVAASYLRETADLWYSSIDRWMYASGSQRAREFDVDGYYVRVAPVEDIDGVSRLTDVVAVRNVDTTHASTAACNLVSPDALALVRFGLRRADDPRIVNTVKLIDALLKVDTPTGPCWRRYNGDGYGEHADGSPFDGTGIGRAWPLLTAERAHYELAAGNRAGAEQLLATMESFASDGGLFPEQTWDSADIPERELFFGRPAGSAMPLVWAHAEYVKLRRSLHDGRIFDLPPQTRARYLDRNVESSLVLWRFNHKVRVMGAGKVLRIETSNAALLHWSGDNWKTARDVNTSDSGLGIHFADLPTAAMVESAEIEFTFYWHDAARWEGTNYSVAVVNATATQSMEPPR